VRAARRAHFPRESGHVSQEISEVKTVVAAG
jgi:hypothetical protein